MEEPRVAILHASQSRVTEPERRRVVSHNPKVSYGVVLWWPGFRPLTSCFSVGFSPV